jgi:hypothetical protein
MIMNEEFDFYLDTMPETRPADYILGCLEGSVYIDFDRCGNGLIRLKRISFDRYGCADLGEKAIPMDETDSRVFKEIIENGLANQEQLTKIIKNVIWNNRELIWEDALLEYGLT